MILEPQKTISSESDIQKSTSPIEQKPTLKAEQKFFELRLFGLPIFKITSNK